MQTAKKRDRSVNFTREETEILISLIEERKGIIENKKSDAVTWQDKEVAWKAIENEFNSSSSGIFRDAKHLKLKYEALKRDTRKKASAVRAEKYKTGGGTSSVPPLSPLEQKVKDMILLSVEGEKSEFDSDQIKSPMISDDKEDNNTSSVTPSKVVVVLPTDVIADDNEGNNTSSITSSNVIAISTDDCEEIDFTEQEPCSKKQKLSDFTLPSTSSVNSEQTEFQSAQSQSEKWDKWKPASLKTKKHPTLNIATKSKRPFDKLAVKKMDLVETQKQLLEEEKEQKQLQKQILQEELNHKRKMYALESEYMLLKIEILKLELENKNKK